MADAYQPIRIWEVLVVAASTLIGAFLTWRPESRGLGVVVVILVLAYVAIGVGRWFEYRRLTSKPHLELRIHEAYIKTAERTASCFCACRFTMKSDYPSITHQRIYTH